MGGIVVSNKISKTYRQTVYQKTQKIIGPETIGPGLGWFVSERV